MREIEFRGKRIGDGKWVYGYYFEDTGGLSVIQKPRTQTTYTVDPATVGQFSGLEDKHARRIYEGDILQSENYRPEPVNWIDGDFMLGDKFTGGFLSEWCYVSEIIGNVHDNPELLEVGE